METDAYDAAQSIFRGTFDLADIVFLIILLFLLLCSALASASEVAYFSLSPGELEKLKEKGYDKVANLHQKPNLLLSTILITNNFVNVGIVILSTYLVNSLFDFSGNPVLGFIIQVIGVTFIILLFGEIIPKLYANRSQVKMAIFMAGPLTFLTYLFRPLSTLLIRSTSLISKRMAKKDGLSMDQLSKALELTEDAEINDEKDILEGIVRFSNIAAIDIIRPRINIIALDIEDSFEVVKNVVIEHGYSRLPVYRENLDTIEGILYVKDLLAHLKEPQNFAWQSLIRPAYFVPESIHADVLFKQMKKTHNYFAVVLDEYGGMTGIVTMNDLLEQIVGDLDEEPTPEEEEPEIEKIDSLTWKIQGGADLEEVAETLGVELPVEEYDTFGGYIFGNYGTIPDDGSVFEISLPPLHIKVTEIKDHRIKKALVCFEKEV